MANSCVTSYGVGRYVASEGDTLWLPRGYQKDGSIRGVVYCHGAGELSATPLNAGGGKTNEAALLNAIGSVYPMVSVDSGVWAQGGITDSNSWGNTNAQTRVGQAITWLQAAGGGGAKTGKVILFGISMGHAVSMNYAQANSANVQAILAVLPVNDLDDIRDNNRGSYQSSISTAWGTGAWISAGNPALPAAANPAKTTNQTNLGAIPQRLYYASDDAICMPATVTTLVTNLPIITTVNLGTGGHSDASVGHVSIPDIMAWLAARA